MASTTCSWSPTFPRSPRRDPEREAASVDSEPVAGEDESELGATRAVWRDGRRILRVRTLRYLIVGSAITAGAALGHRVLGEDVLRAPHDAHVGAGLGRRGRAPVGRGGARHRGGGIATDRLRRRVRGAPMVVAGVSQSLGALFLMVVFIGVPLPVMLFAALIGAALLVAGFPALTTMTAEVVPASIRGLTFSVTSFLAALGVGGVAAADRRDRRSVRLRRRRRDQGQPQLRLPHRHAVGADRRARRAARTQVRRGRHRARGRARPPSSRRNGVPTRRRPTPRATSSRQASPRFLSIFSISAQCISSFRIVWRASSSRETSTPSLTRNNFL